MRIDFGRRGSRRRPRGRMAVVIGSCASVVAFAAFGLSQAHAEDVASAGQVGFDFSNTKLQSVRVFWKDASETWQGKCVPKAPTAVVTDGGFKAESVIVLSFVTSDCSGDKLHDDTVNHSGTDSWIISMQTLDDDDPVRWTA